MGNDIPHRVKASHELGEAVGLKLGRLYRWPVHRDHVAKPLVPSLSLGRRSFTRTHLAEMSVGKVRGADTSASFDCLAHRLLFRVHSCYRALSGLDYTSPRCCCRLVLGTTQPVPVSDELSNTPCCLCIELLTGYTATTICKLISRSLV